MRTHPRCHPASLQECIILASDLDVCLGLRTHDHWQPSLQNGLATGCPTVLPRIPTVLPLALCCSTRAQSIAQGAAELGEGEAIRWAYAQGVLQEVLASQARVPPQPHDQLLLPAHTVHAHHRPHSTCSPGSESLRNTRTSSCPPTQHMLTVSQRTLHAHVFTDLQHMQCSCHPPSACSPCRSRWVLCLGEMR